uniref:Uncharacterized protein n=1 Tax=Vespula pensylvanica TaxID=30213 RepID=A0A834UGT4_VESPE|nr:hypothetical protein H0235_001447 [Vespula pensylvanica]
MTIKFPISIACTTINETVARKRNYRRLVTAAKPCLPQVPYVIIDTIDHNTIERRQEQYYRGYKDSINYKSCPVEEPKAKTSISGGSIESHLVEHLRLLVRPLYRKHEDNANGEEKSTETYGSRLSRL